MECAATVEKRSFDNIIKIIFNNWTGLKLVLEHGVCNNENILKLKVNTMVESVKDILSDSENNTWQDVANVLSSTMDSEFNTILEDGSGDQVGYQIWNLFKLWCSGNTKEVASQLSNCLNSNPIFSTHKGVDACMLEAQTNESDAGDEKNSVK